MVKHTEHKEEAQKENNELYSKKVKAGTRTYFFDVKATRANDYYIKITESRKRMKEDGHFYEKHKIFLYKEDLNKFIEALQGTIEHIKKQLPAYDFNQFANREDEAHPADMLTQEDPSTDATVGLG